MSLESGFCVKCYGQKELRINLSKDDKKKRGICYSCHDIYFDHYRCENCHSPIQFSLKKYEQHIIEDHKDGIKAVSLLIGEHALAKNIDEWQNF
jgi:hypothetical protein